MKKPKQKLVETKKISCPKQLYPRNHYDWMTVYNYRNSMDAGANFPPIKVAQYNKQLVLIDGRHRLEAAKLRKDKYIAVELNSRLTEKEIYTMAVTCNVEHGKNLTIQEQAQAALKLQTKFKYSMEEISEIIRIPITKLEPFVAKRMVNTTTGDVAVLKSPITHLNNKTVNEQKLDNAQKVFYSKSQYDMIRELVVLIQNRMLNLKDIKTKQMLIHLKKLLNNLKLGR